jgi:exopolyphosphatase/guanosine-5'-triphosphate,3'-diphosphate pyrophosphatase
MLSKKKHKKQNLAAIDIGSNAIRMVLAQHSLKGLKTIKKYRFPIRLGEDVFAEGKISGKNLKQSARTFKKFRELSDRYHVSKIRAVGTSALREAKNQKAFCELMLRKSQIPIEIIDGVEEARLIHMAVRREVHLEKSLALLVDIGGGSVELTVSENGCLSATQSFPFGTVRTLHRLKKRNLSENQLGVIIADFVDSISLFLQSSTSNKNPHGKIDFIVGTGGNLETIGKLKQMFLRAQVSTMVSLSELGMIIQELQSMSIKARVEILGLRKDRADVILPASLLIQTVMIQAGVSDLIIPHVGLKDGLLWSLT